MSSFFGVLTKGVIRAEWVAIVATHTFPPKAGKKSEGVKFPPKAGKKSERKNLIEFCADSLSIVAPIRGQNVEMLSRNHGVVARRKNKEKEKGRKKNCFNLGASEPFFTMKIPKKSPLARRR